MEKKLNSNHDAGALTSNVPIKQELLWLPADAQASEKEVPVDSLQFIKTEKPCLEIQEEYVLNGEDFLDTAEAATAFVASAAKKCKKRKRRKENRKVLYDWSDSALISQLIALVERRRALWDAGLAEYKLPKVEAWQEIAEELGNGIKWNDAKVKWANLRVTFRANLAKLKSKKSGQGRLELETVVWKHFKEMMFLEATEVRQTCESTSSMNLCNAVGELTNFDEISPTSPTVVGKRRKRERSRASTSPSPSPSPPSTLSNSSIKEMAKEVLLNFQTRQRPDHHSVYGEYIASELRNLTSGASNELRFRISRTLYEFKKELLCRDTP